MVMGRLCIWNAYRRAARALIARACMECSEVPPLWLAIDSILYYLWASLLRAASDSFPTSVDNSVDPPVLLLIIIILNVYSESY